MKNKKRKNLLEQKKIFDIMGVTYLTLQDKERIKYVAGRIMEIETSTVLKGEIVSLGTAFINNAQNIANIFGDELFGTVISLSSVHCESIHSDPYQFNCLVNYDVDIYTQDSVDGKGIVKYFNLPKEFDETGSVFLGHELLHGIKDTNLNEFILMFQFLEVIPLFYELVSTEGDLQLRNRVMNIRIQALKDAYTNYQNLLVSMKKTKDNKDLYKLQMNCYGLYLNSFYYALVLYSLYKNDKELVISCINKVLNRDKSTLDMLVELGIDNGDFNIIFDTELDDIKTNLK